jgi:hypothetical protein
VNIRGIRAVAYEEVFEHQFEPAMDKALSTGVRGAFVGGCTFGVASGLIYAAEALLFYIGAVLIVRGMYTYLQMVEVLNLVVFTASIGSQLMVFSAFSSSIVIHNFVCLLILLYSPTYCKIGAGNERLQQAAEARDQHRRVQEYSVP